MVAKYNYVKMNKSYSLIAELLTDFLYPVLYIH